MLTGRELVLVAQAKNARIYLFETRCRSRAIREHIYSRTFSPHGLCLQLVGKDLAHYARIGTNATPCWVAPLQGCFVRAWARQSGVYCGNNDVVEGAFLVVPKNNAELTFRHWNDKGLESETFAGWGGWFIGGHHMGSGYR